MKRSHMLAVIVAVAAVAIVVTWAVMRRGSGDDGADDDIEMPPTMSPSPLFPSPLATLPVAPMGITLAPSLATVAISPTLMPQLIGYAGPGDDDYGLVN